MRQARASTVVPGHPDYELLSLLAGDIKGRLAAHPEAALANAIVEAIEFVLDPVRTGRTSISQLDNVEKTFIGLKVEHFVRDLLDAPKGIRDLDISGHDVDVKNTVSPGWAWMIPPETFRSVEPVLLIASNEISRRAWMGLLIAREEYLGRPNRDGKRSILSSAHENILWLAAGVAWPANRWEGIDMLRFRELRGIAGGAKRAAQFFREYLNRITHRRVLMALLHDQDDPMKRLRANGGAPDRLAPEGILLLSGRYNGPELGRRGLLVAADEFVALRA